MNIAQAFLDRRLFAAALGDLETWQTWLTVLCAAFALPLTVDQQLLFAQIAGGRLPLSKAARELWIVAGRRSGKSRMAALVALFIALFVKHRAAPGERPMVLVIAGSVDQADTVFGFIRGFLEASRALDKEVAAVKHREVRLRNGVILAVHACSFRTVRGRTLVAAVFDEVAFWKDESTATPDVEVYRAVRPALATTKGMLIGISTPYRKLGLFHKKWRDNFGRDTDTLVVQGATPVFNSTIDEAEIAAQRADDPQGAIAEWDAQFRADIASFLDDASIDRSIDHGRPLELPPREGVKYLAFTDPAAGGPDRSALCIGHREGERFIADAIRGRHGDPYAAAREFAALAKEYHCRVILGDGYAKEWVSNFYRDDAGLEYRKSPLAKSDLYLEGWAAFNRGLVSFADDATLQRELRLLERQTTRSGKDSVSHGKYGHDDLANALFGCMYVAAQAAKRARHAVPIVEPSIFSNGQWWSDGQANTPAPAGYRPTNEPWRPYVAGPDIGLRTLGPPPGSGPREW